MTSRSQRRPRSWIHVITRSLVGVIALVASAMVLSVTLGNAGFQKEDSDACYSRQPPPDAGVTDNAVADVAADRQLMPLGVRCLYEGPQGGTVVISDIEPWHTVLLVAGLLLMVSAVWLPFRAPRETRSRPARIRSTGVAPS